MTKVTRMGALLALYVISFLVSAVTVTSDEVFCECEYYTTEGTVCRVLNPDLGTYEECSLFVEEAVSVCGNKKCEGPTETCDDGNGVGGDGCSLCTTDPHWTCTNSQCNNPNPGVEEIDCTLDTPNIDQPLLSFHRGVSQLTLSGTAFTYGNTSSTSSVSIELTGAVSGTCFVDSLPDPMPITNSQVSCTLPSNETWVFSDTVNASTALVYAQVTRVQDGKQSGVTSVGYTRDDPSVQRSESLFSLHSVLNEDVSVVTIQGRSFRGVSSDTLSAFVAAGPLDSSPTQSGTMVSAAISMVNDTAVVISIGSLARMQGGHVLYATVERGEDNRKSAIVPIHGIITTPVVTGVGVAHPQPPANLNQPTPLGLERLNITGSNFTGNVDLPGQGLPNAYYLSGINVGGLPCDSPNVLSPTLAQCTVRAGYGHGLGVQLVGKQQLYNSVGIGLFSYAGPEVSSTSPSSDTAGGTFITVIGRNFGLNATAEQSGVSIGVRLDGKLCVQPAIVNDTYLTCVTSTAGGQGTGKAAEVTIADVTGTSPTAFSYLPPGITRISPFRGSTLGTTPLTIFGSNFGPPGDGLAQVTLNGEVCTIETRVSHSQIICTTPSGTAGAAPVFVTIAGQRSQTQQLYTYSEGSEELCRNGKEVHAHLKQRSFAGVEYFHNIALKKNATSPASAIHSYYEELTDGDRCCRATPRSQGLTCGLRFQPNQVTNVTYTIDLGAPAYVNALRTAWPDPCREEPRPGYFIEYLSVTESGQVQGWKTLRYRQTEIDRDAGDLITQVASQSINPCVAIRGDLLPVSLCADFFKEGVLGTAIRIAFDNRELPQGSGWIYETEVNGIFLTDTYNLRANWTANVTDYLSTGESIEYRTSLTAIDKANPLQPHITRKTALSVTIPMFTIESINVLGRVLSTIPAVELSATNATAQNWTATGSSYPTVVAVVVNDVTQEVLKDMSGDQLVIERVLSPNGTAVFDGVHMLSPSLGNYHVRVGYIVETSLVHAYNLSVSIIEGDPARLRTLTVLPSQARAVRTLELSPIDMEYTDAAMNSLVERNVPVGTINLYYLSAAQSNLTTDQVIATSNDTIIGSVTHSTVGAVTMASPQWEKPQIGRYVLRPVSSLSGIVTESVSFIVLVGEPAQLLVKTPLPLVTVSLSLSSFTCSVVVTDNADNPVGNIDLLRVVEVTLVKSPVPGDLNALLTGDRSVTIVNGEGVISGAQLIAPKVGEYSIALNSEGLAQTIMPVRINPGPPDALIAEWKPPIVTGANSTSAPAKIVSLVQSPLGTFHVKVIDAGGNEALTTEPVRIGVRTPNVTSTSVLGVPSGLSIAAGRTSVDITTLAFRTPKIGSHVVEFTNPNLAPGLVTIPVFTGPSTSVKVPADSLGRFSIPFRAAKTVQLPKLPLTGSDAGGNPAPLPAGLNLAVHHTPPVLRQPAKSGNQSSSASSSGTLSLLQTQSQLYASVTSASGSAEIPGLGLPQPTVGSHSISISIGSLATTVSFAIVPGPPHHVLASSNPPEKLHDNSLQMARVPTVLVKDELGNNVQNETVSVSIHVIGNQTILHGTSTVIVDTDGQAAFRDFSFRGLRNSVYTLGFSIPAISPDIAPVYNITIASCQSVSENTEASSDGFDCVCARGAILGADSGCVQCPEDTFKPDPGNINVCQECGLNRGTDRLLGVSNRTSGCLCKPGFYQREMSYDVECVPCPTGATCAGLSFSVDESYWRPSSNVYAVYPCPAGSSACQGHQDGVGCEPGYTGPLCAVCQPNHAQFNGKCSPCLGPEPSWMIFVVAVVVLVTVCVILVRRAQKGKSDRSIIMVLIINYLQMLGLVGDLNVPWHGSTFGLFKSADSASTIALSFHPLQCALQLTYFQRLLFYLMLPGTLIVVPVIVYGIVYAIKYLKLKPINRPGTFASYLMTRTAVAFSVLALLFHAIITKNIMLLFKCKELADEEGRPVSLLLADTTIRCWEGEHSAWVAIVTIFFTLYCVGVPCVVAVGLILKKQYFLRPQSVKLWGFLFMAYREKHMYFEMIVVLRKMALIAVIVFLAENPTLQTYMAIWFVFLALGIVIQILPYRNAHNGRLEQASLASILFSLQVALLFLTEVGEDKDSLLAIFASAMVYIMNVACMLWLLYALFTAKRRKRHHHHNNQSKGQTSGHVLPVTAGTGSTSRPSTAGKRSSSPSGSSSSSSYSDDSGSYSDSGPPTSQTPRPILVGPAGAAQRLGRYRVLEELCSERIDTLRTQLRSAGLDPATNAPPVANDNGEAHAAWNELKSLTNILNRSSSYEGGLTAMAGPTQATTYGGADCDAIDSGSFNHQQEGINDTSIVSPDGSVSSVGPTATGVEEAMSEGGARSEVSTPSPVPAKASNREDSVPNLNSTTQGLPPFINQELSFIDVEDVDVEKVSTPTSVATGPASPLSVSVRKTPRPLPRPPELVSRIEKVREDTDELDVLLSSLKKMQKPMRPPPLNQSTRSKGQIRAVPPLQDKK